MIYSQIKHLTAINKILKINKIYILTLTILLKMITPIRKIQPNNKIRTNDLALEMNKVSLEEDTNKKAFEYEDQIMVTQTGDPNNKSKPAYRKY